MRILMKGGAGTLIVAGAFAAFVACTTAPAAPEEYRPGVSRKVLFIGNSLTYVNDLPGMVQALASAGGLEVTTASVVQGGYSLEDHWNDGVAQQMIASQPWDVVILQQGPSSLPESRVNLLEYAGRFAPLIRRAGAVPALYMVWPDTTRMAFFDDVRESYRLAADSVNGLFLPCGEAWRAAWRRNGAFPLYGADGFHPAPLGTYLAALVIVHRVTGRSPRVLPAQVTVPGGLRINLDTRAADMIRNAAFEADSIY